jgi:RNA-binding protein
MKTVDNKKIQELRSQAQSIEATLHVGKNGVTDAMVEELKAQIKRQKLVKVRLLPAATGTSTVTEQAQALADATKSTLVEVRGNTAVLWRP